MTPGSIAPVSLRDGIEIQHPLLVVSGYLESWSFEAGDVSSSFDEPDLRLANRGGARISTAEIAATLERRRAIELALQAIPPGASLAGTPRLVPWQPLGKLVDGFADLRGIGLSKMTKALQRTKTKALPRRRMALQMKRTALRTKTKALRRTRTAPRTP